jgi:hypothetical protein
MLREVAQHLNWMLLNGARDRLGVLFGTYNALSLTTPHMLIGLVVVLALWVLAGLEVRA